MPLRSEAMTAVEPLPPGSLAPARTVPGAAIVGLFMLAVFTGSALLFLVQPMFARLVLPHLGGSPSVWNTCMLFFQALLLLGYLYAHVAPNALTVRGHAIAHLPLICAPVVVLPISVSPPSGGLAESPTGWLLVTAALAVGLPFFVLSTSAPLLQRWFAALPHPSARDPYFLYAASNLGSLVALLGYPFVFEPIVGLASQGRVWAWGYGIFALLTAGCALAVRRFVADEPGTPDRSGVALPTLSWRQRLSWLLLAFVPSTLMLGVTTHISTDIAAFPLLWILPLALYLLTFVVAFGSAPPDAARLAAPTGLLTFGTLASLILNVQPIWAILLHLLTFAAAALLCHLRLARSRPPASHLTEFYIWLSAGGVLGGVFNGVIAPAVFSTVLEYPLALAAVILIAAAARTSAPPAPLWLRRSMVGAAGLSIVAFAALPRWPTLKFAHLIAATVLVVLAMLERRNLGRVVPPLVVVSALGLMWAGRARPAGVAVHTERSFFGVHRILDARDGSHRTLYHGSTLHGWQALPSGTCEPSSYYSRKGPIGDVFAAADGRFDRVAVVGLGIGALACYAEPGDAWTFYEIDPAVERLATNPAYFDHIARSHGRVDVVVADGRVGLRGATAHSYDLIVLDAFSSDAIPVHLLTREAMELYFSRLTSGGLVAIHISNRYLRLAPPLAALARDLGLHGYVRGESISSTEDARQGRTSSSWVVLARAPGDTMGLDRVRGWRPLVHSPGVRVWTDDYANVLQALLSTRFE